MRPSRRPHATPSARRTFERSLRTWGATLLKYRLRVVADLAVAALVLSLPFSLRAAPSIAAATTVPESAPMADVLALSVGVDAPRAQVAARGSITAAGDPRTAIAEAPKAPVRHTLTANDSLQSIANHFGVSAEAIAYSNGITDPNIRPLAGKEILIPPGEGALYVVQAGDTIEGVGAKFRVPARAIMDHNRLYFEPELFAPGQRIFVPGATVPGLVYVAANPRERISAPSVLSRPAVAAAASGSFLMPVTVGARVTQPFWAYHTGVDIATAYGSGVGASDTGIVVATGWVPVGGLSIRIQHANGFETGYYHLGAIFVAPGQQVSRAQVIGSIGMTGVTTGPHVHWELKRNGAFVNPLAYTAR